MNFLYRTAAAPPPPPPEPPRVPEQDHHNDDFEKPIRTLEGLIAEDTHMPSSARPSSARPSEDGASYGGRAEDAGRESVSLDAKSPVLPGTHTDVSEDEGWITIPHKALPENWNDVSEMAQLQPLDRSFLVPGEQVHILACLSASKQDVQVISPFRVAALMSKNGNALQHSSNKSGPVSANDLDNGTAEENDCQDVENNEQSVKLNGDASPSKHDISETQTLLQMEDHKQQIELILQRLRESNFFVRIAESDEPLWSKKRVSTSNMEDGQNYSDSKGHNRTSRNTAYNTVSDKGIFDGSTSGGVARDTVKCYPLQNGDIVVVLQVNVGVNKLEDPVLEILQFEKCMSGKYMPQNLVDGLSGSYDDPCQELLSWLLPLDRTLPPRSLSPPTLNPSVSHKQSYSTGSQIFNFRSYSMPSQSSVQLTSNIRPPPISESQEFMPEKPAKTPDTINDGQLSFRGVPLEPERYSVRCGLEGVYLPGKRWRKKVEIIQPIEVHSFAAKCTVENLLCVTVKNIAPAHAKDIVVFIDAITIVFEEASKGGAPLSLPIASIEVGHGLSLPNLALRMSEEHSFVLKPAAMSTRDRRTNSDAPAPPALSLPTMTGATLNTHTPKIADPYVAPSDQYAILVSYRCNYSESKLFFKQATSWRPCAASDLMISVSSELSLRNPSLSAQVPQLPVQVLTVEATNMSSENLTLTVLAPEASGSSSVVSLNSSPTTPNSSYDGLNESARESGLGKHVGFRKLNSDIAGPPKEGDNSGNRTATASGCTHLWLQSAVPLGCVPAHSSTTVKLELLPLTDGIITLDTLQIRAREKGLTYIPEHSLEIHATSGILSGRA